MNQKKMLELGIKKLKENEIEEGELKAKRLLEYICNQTRHQCIVNELNEESKEIQEIYQKKIEEIVNGKPLQYITNQQFFMGLNFYVDENVLIPQPDTEILVEQGLNILNNKNTEEPFSISSSRYQQQNKKVLDLCTGSGAIAVSIAHYSPYTKIIATDISEKALVVARKNAKLNKVESRITFMQSDLFENININDFDIIVSNPPYIETSVIPTLSKEVQKEPKLALDGGKDGLFFYKSIIQKASEYLKDKGYLILEIGYDQGEKVSKLPEIMENTNIVLITKQPIKDLAGNDRVLIFQKRSATN